MNKYWIVIAAQVSGGFRLCGWTGLLRLGSPSVPFWMWLISPLLCTCAARAARRPGGQEARRPGLLPPGVCITYPAWGLTMGLGMGWAPGNSLSVLHPTVLPSSCPPPPVTPPHRALWFAGGHTGPAPSAWSWSLRAGLGRLGPRWLLWATSLTLLPPRCPPAVGASALFPW